MNRSEATAFVKKLRQQYPDPKTVESSEGVRGAYCVGGALCLELRPNSPPFPSDEELAEALQTTNPALAQGFVFSETTAGFVSYILKANDVYGDFEDAWQTLEDALAWPN